MQPIPSVPIVFTDLRDRDAKERKRLEALKAELELRKARNGRVQPPNGFLPADKQKLLDDTIKTLAQKVVDPFFLGVQKHLGALNVNVADHGQGKLPSQQNFVPAVPGGAAAQGLAPLTADEVKLVAVYGLVSLDSADPANPRFAETIPIAMGEFTRDAALFDRLIGILVDGGHINQGGELSAVQIANVYRTLRGQGAAATDSLLPLKVRTALAKIGGGDDTASFATEIDLPNLEEQADRLIQADNLKALQAIYFASMLEEMKFFQAIDLALEQWQLGTIVLTRGSAGTRFYEYWRKSNDRFSEIERRSLYARAFGVPGGDAVQGAPNREFKDLWLRFLSAVSAFARQIEVDNLLRSNSPGSVSQELVRQTGRDLATNLSLHGYGMAYFAATELQQQINEVKDLLSDAEVKAAYGARDMFQVIEQIVLMSGGGISNSIQKRVSAQSGAVIIRWLANNSDKLSGIDFGDVIDRNVIRNPLPRVPGDKITTNPSDSDLVNAVEQWLAVNGIQDTTIQEQAQAAEPPRTPTRPFQLPQAARDLIGDIDLPMAASAGAGNGRGNGGSYGQSHGNSRARTAHR
jgi:hypothetical protein